MDSCLYPSRVQFIIERFDVVSGRSLDRYLSSVVRTCPMVQGPGWWISVWRSNGGLKENERVVGYIPCELDIIRFDKRRWGQ